MSQRIFDSAVQHKNRLCVRGGTIVRPYADDHPVDDHAGVADVRAKVRRLIRADEFFWDFYPYAVYPRFDFVLHLVDVATVDRMAISIMVSGISTCETELAGCRKEDFWLIVTVKEWR
jgi:hypothetical protein